VANFEQQYPELFKVAFAAAYRILVQRDDAGDVAQEVMVRAYVRWDRIAGYCVPWVSRAATNLALDQVKRQPAKVADRDECAADVGIDEYLDLVEAISRLPKRQREVIFLRYYAGLSEQETADLLHRAPGTVKAHASRGLRALENHLKEKIP